MHIFILVYTELLICGVMIKKNKIMNNLSWRMCKPLPILGTLHECIQMGKGTDNERVKRSKGAEEKDWLEEQAWTEHKEGHFRAEHIVEFCISFFLWGWGGGVSFAFHFVSGKSIIFVPDRVK